MRKNKEELAVSQKQIPLVVFLESYNQNIPADFPRASIATLKEFRNMHPRLFRNGDMWSIDLHRKRLIDWLSVYRDIA